MDFTLQQPASHAKRATRSFTNLNHVSSLAPLTSRLPLSDDDLPTAPLEPYHQPHHTYLHGRSVPTTPRVLSRSSSRTNLVAAAAAASHPAKITTSRSAAHLSAIPSRTAGTRVAIPNRTSAQIRRAKGDLKLSAITVADPGGHDDVDWLHRAGTMMASSSRESKGQTWLVSRASSTSLADQGEVHADGEKDDFTMKRESREASRHTSRRGSLSAACDADDEISPITTRGGRSFGAGTPRTISQYGSRLNSRTGSKVRLVIPPAEELARGGYFGEDTTEHEDDDGVTGPDFVDLQEPESEPDLGDDVESSKRDEAMITRLSRANSLGLGGLVENLLGWSLFAGHEDAETTKPGTLDDEPPAEPDEPATRRSIHDLRAPATESVRAAPEAEGTNAWQDAAWLLDVASKIML